MDADGHKAWWLGSGGGEQADGRAVMLLASRPHSAAGELKLMMYWSLTAAGLLLSLTVVVMVLRRLHVTPVKRERAQQPRTTPTSAWVEAGKRIQVREGGGDDDGSRDDTVDFDPDELGPDDVGGGPRGGGGRR